MAIMSEPLDVRPCFDGAQWTDQTIAAWLAGFFDRAGRIDLGKRRSVVLTVYDMHPHTLSLIQQKLKAGAIETSSGRNGRMLHVWRISEHREVWRVVTTMLLYLTTQREAAYQAIERLKEIEAKQAERAKRDREILALWLEGRPQRTIAHALGVSVTAVSDAIGRYQRGPDAMIER